MREEIENRPSACLIIGLILGLIVLNYPLGCVGLAAFLVWLRPLRSRFLIGCAFVVGLALCPVQPLTLRANTLVHGVARVLSVPVLYPDGQACEIQTDRYRLLLTLPRNPGVMLGDEISVSGIAKPIQASTGNRRYLDEAQGRIQVSRVELVSEGSWFVHLADRWRRSFMSFAERNLSPKSASLVDAICFNARTMLDLQTKEELTQSGSVHVVSASGLQVFVLGAFLTMALRFFPVTRLVQILLLGSVLAVYALAAGLQPQIVRAAFMTLVGMSAFLFKRDSDALSALSLSGFLYLLWRPEAVYGMAFQLSFVAVAFIALFYNRNHIEPTKGGVNIVRLANEFIKLTVVVSLATAPLVAYYLGVITGASVFSNLLLFWCLPLIVGIGFFSHGVSLFLPALGDGIATHLLAPLCHWIYGVLDFVGSGPGAIQVPHFSALWLVAFYGAWLMTYRRRVVQP